MYLNNIQLIGFLGGDAEMKLTNGDKAFTTFSLATKSTWMKEGQRHEQTEWHSVVVWGKLGEYAAAFKKGAHILVEGELRSREYDGQNGHVKTYDIVANSIVNLRKDQRRREDEDNVEDRP